MTVHAFVDESERNHRYILCVVLVDPAELVRLRKHVRALLMPGQRELHFRNEKSPRRRVLADRLAAMEVSARIYTAPSCSRTNEQARQRCLSQAIRDLLVMRAHRVVLDTRDRRDAHDHVTIWRHLGSQPARTGLAYEHLDSVTEPLCWIADAVAWCHGAAGDWRRRIKPIIGDVIDL